MRSRGRVTGVAPGNASSFSASASTRCVQCSSTCSERALAVSDTSSGTGCYVVAWDVLLLQWHATFCRGMRRSFMACDVLLHPDSKSMFRKRLRLRHGQRHGMIYCLATRARCSKSLSAWHTTACMQQQHAACFPSRAVCSVPVLCVQTRGCTAQCKRKALDIMRKEQVATTIRTR